MSSFTAANLSANDRKNMAIQALASVEASITDLAHENQVSRKFIYQQAGKTPLSIYVEITLLFGEIVRSVVPTKHQKELKCRREYDKSLSSPPKPVLQSER